MSAALTQIDPGLSSLPATDAEAGIRALEVERAGLDAVIAAMRNGLSRPFSEAVSKIAQRPGRVIVSGMGKSGHIGRKIAATLASTGTPAYFVHPGEASHGDLGMICDDDAVLALSWSGETSELSDLIGYCKRRGVLLIALTGRRESALARAADIPLVLPKITEACPNGLAPTTSTTVQLALGDALAVALLERRGFTASDFRGYHPGGKLGALLKRVEEIMHRGERLPVARLGETMDAALALQSGKGFGCVLVVDPEGRLAGIVTDGDIRRHMGNDLLARRVEEVMTQTPVSIPPSTLLPKALEILESSAISVLPVVDDGKPVGLVHVLDLLHARIA